AGGRGYTRPPSLVSLWSTSPFLLNNSVGPFDPDPSVEHRIASFNAAIEQMLWPERRQQDSALSGKIPGMIDRTTEQSYVRVAGGFLPGALQGLLGAGERVAPWIFGNGGIEMGPIPAGAPVALLASLNPLAEDGQDPADHARRLFELVNTLDRDLKKLGPKPSNERAAEVFGNSVDKLLGLSKCPDLIVNRGHYFGTDFREPGEAANARQPGLSDADKKALIEFLKTF
ncbi:MAG: hypothetical protein JO022_02605, partial [Acidobacteriaceae bacterium]|nr:hypothetical protein [Acidobacteriaceae bacterium]